MLSKRGMAVTKMHTRVWQRLSAGAIVLLILSFAHPLFASEPQQWFRSLHQLEQRITHYQVETEYLQDRIAGNARLHSAQVEELQLARRATAHVREQAREILRHWEHTWRDVERAAYYGEVGASSDTKILLLHAQPHTLDAVSDDLTLLRAVERDTSRMQALLIMQGRLHVALAHNSAMIASVRREREWLVEQTRKEDAKKQAESELSETDEALTSTFETFPRHRSSEDFHRRKGTLLPPVSAPPAHRFGPRRQRQSWSFVRHSGHTYSVPEGTSVRAVAAGTVVFAQRLEGYGQLVVIDHGSGYHTIYAHLKSMDVHVGQVLGRGKEIGESGQSGSLEGPKLYFELRRNGNPIDPESWFVRQ